MTFSPLLQDISCPSKQAMEKNTDISMEKKKKKNTSFFSKHFKKIYPIGLKRAPLSLSSLSLSLSQNSTDSSLTNPNSETLHQKISLALTLIAPQGRREEPTATIPLQQPSTNDPTGEEATTRPRCNWITKTSDKLYVQFHDECWGIPTYDDHKMFELLTMCGMLMDFNWTEILKRRQLLREAFEGFDPNNVAEMGETDISDIASNKELSLAESRVRCIIDNAKCITKVAREYGSFSTYIWDHVSYRTMINRFRHPTNIPLRTPKAEVMSKDLVRRGFRLVGPVIVYSFMEAAGMVIDHVVGCFRYAECVNLAERPWRHV